MKKNILSAVSVGLSIASVPALAAAYNDTAPETVQTVIEGIPEPDLIIPRDGSTCDPSVIARNLSRLNALGVLTKVQLSKTVATGHCYGMPCNDQDMQRALEAHCKKADVLAIIVDTLKAR